MKQLSILHLGIGNVGQTLVRQINASVRKELVYCGLFTTRFGIFKKSGFSAAELKTIPKSLIDKTSSLELALHQIPSPFVLIDTTASEKTIPFLKKALKKGGYVVLSNKKPLTGSQKEFDELQRIGKQRFLYETTVGAGLPVIQTLNTLLETGDEVISIQGCFSGTLGYLFSQLEKGVPFSQAVNDAKKQGFTEPDPRDDLSGVDVARKALILARLLGKKLALKDVQLESLYPVKMSKLSIEEFLTQTVSLDKAYKEKTENAKKQGKVLRYVAKISNAGCKVGIEAVDKISDIGSLQGPDNLIIFKTKRYNKNPLVIKGPGAGAEVTAAGVFGDLQQIVKRI